MEGSAHRQGHGALRALFLALGDGAIDRGGVPRDHRLLGRVVVRRFDHAARLLRLHFLARLGDELWIETEDGRHRAFARGDRLLHESAARP